MYRPSSSNQSYLNIPNIISAAEITNSDAIHPGYGFLSENAQFSKICSENDIKFIGADPKMISKMGDKAMARETMLKAGVPVIPGSDGIIKDISSAKKIAKNRISCDVKSHSWRRKKVCVLFNKIRT